MSDGKFSNLFDTVSDQASEFAELPLAAWSDKVPLLEYSCVLHVCDVKA